MIQNLLFDLGGVIMDIKKANCVEAFRQLGLPDPDSFFGEYGQSGVFGQLEAGTISVDEFHAHLRSLFPFPVTDQQIDSAFMKFLIGIPSERLLQLQELRHKYGIYLLSNTNEIMWHDMIDSEFRKNGLDIDGYFDGIVTSFEAKALKPAPEIFRYAEKKLDIKPEETLFLDDSLQNIKAACDLGFQGAHIPEGKEFIEVLKDMNLA